MIDYSFIRLKNSFSAAKNVGDSTASEILDQRFIQLSPKKVYFQLTSVDGGISLIGDYKVEVIDCAETVLADVTDKVFLNEFSRASGENQLGIEFVALGVDFYTKTVFFKFTHTISNAKYYSNPLTITDFQIEETSYFQYKNYDDFRGIPYTASQKWQTISLKTYFDITINESDVQTYFQINNSRTISGRMLIKEFEKYQIDYIHHFGYLRLNTLLAHDLIYLNGVRVTDKAIVESNDREGNSNFFVTSFNVARNYNDELSYNPQVFSLTTNYSPLGVYQVGSVIDPIKITFNSDVELGEGDIRLYQEGVGLIEAYPTTRFVVSGGEVTVDPANPIVLDNTGGTYYFNYDETFFIVLGDCLPALTDNTTWRYRVSLPDFDGGDFNNADFFTN